MMTDALPKPPCGVVAIITSPRYGVMAVGSDFDPAHLPGSDVVEAQRGRARDDAIWTLTVSQCHADIAAVMTRHDRDRLWAGLRSLGYRMEEHVVGGDAGRRRLDR